MCWLFCEPTARCFSFWCRESAHKKKPFYIIRDDYHWGVYSQVVCHRSSKRVHHHRVSRRNIHEVTWVRTPPKTGDHGLPSSLQARELSQELLLLVVLLASGANFAFRTRELLPIGGLFRMRKRSWSFSIVAGDLYRPSKLMHHHCVSHRISKGTSFRQAIVHRLQATIFVEQETYHKNTQFLAIACFVFRASELLQYHLPIGGLFQVRKRPWSFSIVAYDVFRCIESSL